MCGCRTPGRTRRRHRPPARIRRRLRPRRPRWHPSADTLMGRPAHELACLWEFWLLPLVVALLPYRAGIAFARWCAARLPLYDERARAGLAHYHAARPQGEARRWL